jgi:serine protease Do
VDPETIAQLEVVVPGVERRTLKAKLLGIDPLSGLSFIQAMEPHGWQMVKFKSSSALSVGKPVVSVGLALQDPAAPLAVGAGYVSTVLETPGKQAWVTGGSLTAPGSVVFDTAGNAIGLVMGQPLMRYVAPSRQGALNMALQAQDQTAAFTPIEEFLFIIESIPRNGEVRRLPWIGVGRFQAVSEIEANANNITSPAVRIDEIIPGHAADQAGLKNRDIIIALDGKPLEKMATPELVNNAFVQELMRRPVETSVKLTVVRDGAKKDFTLKLAATPELPNEAKKLFHRELGLLVREKVMLDKHLDKTPTANVPGLYVMGVGQRSPAAAAGLQNGDLITAINGQAVQSAEAVGKILDSLMQQSPRPDVKLTVQRGADTTTLVIRPPAAR